MSISPEKPETKSAISRKFSEGLALQDAVSKKKIWRDEDIRAHAAFTNWVQRNASALLASSSCIDVLVNELYLVIPFLEDAQDDKTYRPGVVAARIRSIKEAISRAEGL